MTRPLRNAPPRFEDTPERAELLALYAEVDALLAPWSCAVSGECCHFHLTGREPYPTAVELAELERAMRAAGVNVRAKREKSRGRGRALPVVRDERVCPLLSDDGRCRVYAARPFGCRTFFCERIEGPKKLPRSDIQAISRKIADLSARFAPRDPRPRPLLRALALEGREG